MLLLQVKQVVIFYIEMYFMLYFIK